jgi:hypothetical protein
MLRGLPPDLTPDEAADIRAALPHTIISPNTPPPDPSQTQLATTPFPPRRSLPHRLAAVLTHRLLSVLRGAGPCVARAARQVRALEARWGLVQRAVRWAGREGLAGRAVRWAVVGFAEGVVEGLGRGWVGDEEEEEERGRSRRARRR